MMDYEKLLSPTVVQMKPSGIRKYFDIVASMEGVISLGIGEPDFPTPQAVREAGVASLQDQKTKYTSNFGLMELREEICNYVKRKYDVSYNAVGDVLVTVGGSEAIDTCIRAMVAPGDEVIIPQPCYVCYEPMVNLCGGKAVIIETKAEDGFKVTPEQLRAAITPRTKALILPYPCNPTGGVMRRADLEAIAEVLRETDIFVLSDEIYAELTFGDEPHVSIASIEGMRERTVLVNGFSKAFSMTGWRLGYACGPSQIIKQITKIHQYTIMCAPTTAQYAAIEALRNGDAAVQHMREIYDARRRLIVDGFNKLGLTCREPLGAFYAFPSIQSTGLSSEEFCEKLLHAEKVAIVPGTAFGQGGEGFVRASYCYSTEHIKEALTRIGRFLESLK